ncbi:hypothetical protein Scep_019031 [Stephania cephalantha]|uniref:Uncharacterized protein n=1 Tax=Stephania cephalantha TaxID=152367 RepID=A0AAP0IA83_9MAGN
MSHLGSSNNQCETSNTTLNGDKEHVEFIDENIVNNDDNVDIIDTEEDNVEIVDNVDIGDNNKESNNEDDYEDSVNDSDDGIEAIDLPKGPKEGMIFETIDEVKTSFKLYAKAKGFGARKGKEKAKAADSSHGHPKKKQKLLDNGSLIDEEKGFAPKNPKKPNVRELTVLARLVHRQVAHVICLKTGGRTWMSHYDIFLTWAVVNGVEIDLAYITVSYIYKATLKAKKRLSYAHDFCAIFDDVGLTSLPKKEYERCLNDKKDMIGKKSMPRMQYKFVDGKWINPLHSRKVSNVTTGSGKGKKAGNEKIGKGAMKNAGKESTALRDTEEEMEEEEGNEEDSLIGQDLWILLMMKEVIYQITQTSTQKKRITTQLMELMKKKMMRLLMKVLMNPLINQIMKAMI